MRVLGLDVCAGRCSVALLEGLQTHYFESEVMRRGHVERLAPMVGAALAQVGWRASDLDLITVTTGPGGFTGARLGVAFARGLALASGARAVGVTMFQALAAPFGEKPVLVAIDGGRGEIFMQGFGIGGVLAKPCAAPKERAREMAFGALERLEAGWRLPASRKSRKTEDYNVRSDPTITQNAVGAVLVGSGVEALLAEAPAGRTHAFRRADAARDAVDPVEVARIGATMTGAAPPAPFYLRAPDAKPQRASAGNTLS